MSASYLEELFPGLAGTHYQVTSPEDDRYNCIAWAAGESDRWWAPDPGYHWPGAPRRESVEAFVLVFEGLGYRPCEGGGWEEGFEKVAIFAVGDRGAHVARQVGPDQWTSKCGALEDISHPLEALEGQEYGRVVVVMKRQRE